MQVAVVGAGIVGVCTAYFLAEAGHEVVVMERHKHVAEEATFGDAGLLAADAVAPWAAPGMPDSLFSLLRKNDAALYVHRNWNPSLWDWLRRWTRECTPERYRINRERMHRLASYSHDLMQLLRDHFQLDYEQHAGYLQLFRTEQERQQAEHAVAYLQAANIAHAMLSADEARALEPALHPHTSLAGALHLPAAESGNCPLFARQLRQQAQQMGVEFHFGCDVRDIQPSHRGVMLEVDGAHYSADAVVVAAGADSLQLLQRLKLALPVTGFRHYTATASIRNFDAIPQHALFDAERNVSITRLGNRIRIAGTAELGARADGKRDAALQTLLQAAYDWLPDTSNYNNATLWSGSSLALPDGVPLLGPIAMSNVYLNLGHGSAGWAMAAGSGKCVADLVSGRTPDIDVDGLTGLRYQTA